MEREHWGFNRITKSKKKETTKDFAPTDGKTASAGAVCCDAGDRRWILPEPSTPAGFSTSETVTILYSLAKYPGLIPGGQRLRKVELFS